MTTPDPGPDKGPLVTSRWLLGWLTAMALLAVIVSVWNLIRPIPGVYGMAYLIAWPVLIQPAWAGLTVAIIVVGVLGQLYARQAQRDLAKAQAASVWVCTECPEAGFPGSAFTGQDHIDGSGHLIRYGGPEVLGTSDKPARVDSHGVLRKGPDQ